MAERVPVATFVLVPLTVGVLVGGATIFDAQPATASAAAVAALALAIGAVLGRDRATRIVALALLCGGVLGALRATVACAPLPHDHIAQQAGRAPIAIEASFEQTSHGRRNRRRHSVELDFAFQDRRQCIGRGWLVEQSPAGQHLKKHDAKSPDVGALVG